MHRQIHFPYWLIVIILAAFAVGYFAWTESMNYESGIMDYGSLLTRRQPRLTDSLETTGEYAGWKTYRNEEYGFEVRYPETLSPRSTHNSFLVLTDSDINQKFRISVGLKSQEIEGVEIDPPGLFEELNLRPLIDKTNKNLGADFHRDPPWGYYHVLLGMPDERGTLQFYAQIHEDDLPQYGGNNSDFKIFNQILSTFKFTK